jgi:hypothetical protein
MSGESNSYRIDYTPFRARARTAHISLKTLVGAARFELATPCAQGRCATRLRYAPTTSFILKHPNVISFRKAGALHPRERPHQKRRIRRCCDSLSSPARRNAKTSGRNSPSLTFAEAPFSRFPIHMSLCPTEENSSIRPEPSHTSASTLQRPPQEHCRCKFGFGAECAHGERRTSVAVPAVRAGSLL